MEPFKTESDNTIFGMCTRCKENIYPGEGAIIDRKSGKVWHQVCPPKKLGSNPKDSIGAKKVSITKFPAVGIYHGAHAMMNGAEKYGPYNWRGNKVIASIYVDAAIRHLTAWLEREEIAEDSEVHHLGHAIACCAILLDAQETGNLIDDRPESDGTAIRVLQRLNAVIKKRSEAKK